MFEVVGNEYTVLSEYKSIHEKVLMRHNACGYEWEVEANSFINQKTKCPECMAKWVGRQKALTIDIFKERVASLAGDEYEVVDEYVNYSTKLNIRHTVCNNIFKVTPDKFLRGSRCPYCKMSNGELRVSEVLKKNAIKFDPQHYFNDCRNILPLPFDFAVFNKLNKLVFLIEYDGEFHFEVPRFINDIEVQNKKLSETQFRDSIKNKYCETNNIPLLRIPHWEFKNIEEILTAKLKEFNFL